MVFNVIGWCVFGLLAGGLARLLVPGRDPMGWLATIGLGIAGSFLTGAVFHVLFASSNSGVQPAGFFGSVIGGIAVVLTLRSLKKRSSTQP